MGRSDMIEVHEYLCKHMFKFIYISMCSCSVLSELVDDVIYMVYIYVCMRMCMYVCYLSRGVMRAVQLHEYCVAFAR